MCFPGVSLRSFQTEASTDLDSLRTISFLMGDGSVAARRSSSSLLAKTDGKKNRQIIIR